jgi:hypothetical protein
MTLGGASTMAVAGRPGKKRTARLVAVRAAATYPRLTWSAIMIEGARGSLTCQHNTVTAEERGWPPFGVARVAPGAPR